MSSLQALKLVLRRKGLEGVRGHPLADKVAVGGIALAVLAAVLMLFTDGSVSVPITLLIVGIALIAKSRRTRSPH